MSSETRNCQNCKADFVIEPEDFDFYRKIDVPPPTWCPGCRFQRRAYFRNEGKLFRRESGMSGEKLLTLYPPESGYVVYIDKEWYSDAWDPKEYGREVDFSRPFLAQLKELDLAIPKNRASTLNMVNSDYSANAAELKNCYLLVNSNNSEDCAYGHGIDRCRICVDNSHLQKCEGCHESFWLTNCYRTHFSAQCEDCNDVWFSKDCRGCSNCFGCVNLRLQKYCIFNEQYSKEEYEERLNAMRLDTWSGIQRARAEAESFWKKNPYKYLQGAQNHDVSGEYISHSKNVHDGYIVRECQDLKYIQYIQVPPAKNSMDATVMGWNADLLYETSVCGWGGADLKFCWECWDQVRGLEYCMFCRTSSDIFGCVGMRNGKYCILNKQYQKEEYEALVAKIKKHMDEMPYVDKQGRAYKYGEFFPPEFSPFAYQDTIAAEHFQLSKEEVEATGVRWQEPNTTEYQPTMEASSLPDAIGDAEDEILKEIIQCAECKRAYRIIPQELQFLRQVKMPLPRACPDCRRAARLVHRNKSELYSRQCGCAGARSANDLYGNTKEHFHGAGVCSNQFETSYALDRPEIVYCEQCYNAEVA